MNVCTFNLKVMCCGHVSTFLTDLFSVEHDFSLGGYRLVSLTVAHPTNNRLVHL